MMNLLEIGVLLGVAGWDLERAGKKTTPSLAEAIGKRCSFGADTTAIGCGLPC